MVGAVGGSRRKRQLIQTSLQEENHDSEESIKSKNSKMNTDDHKEENNNLAVQVFLNPLIMKIITKHLPLRSLPTLRSTCKLWNKLMVPEYRQRKSNAPNRHVVIIDKLSVDSVLGLLTECMHNPFSSYSLEDINKMTLSKVQNLFGKIGGVMTHLQLDLTKLPLSVDSFRNLILKQSPMLRSLCIADRGKSAVPRFWSLKLQIPSKHGVEKPTLPNLKNIELELSYFLIPRNSTYATHPFTLLEDLLAAAINLETVRVENYGGSGFINRVLLDIWLKQKDSGNLRKIQEIKLGQGISIQSLETLIELSERESVANRLALKTLDLRRFLSANCFIHLHGSRLMNQFLSLQASSLEKLTASLTPWMGEANENYKLILPVMPSLKILELQIAYFLPPDDAAANANNGVNNNNAGNNDGNNDVAANNGENHLLPNITFDSLLTNFPNLQKLTLLANEGMVLQYPYEDEQEVTIRLAVWTQLMKQLGPEPHLGITELNVSLEDHSCYLMELASLFPNVKKLKICFRSRIFSEVWRLWPKLEVLSIGLQFLPGKAEIDSSLTGVPIVSLKLLKELNWKDYKTEAGISDLHELRQLKLKYMLVDKRKPGYVTDFSANYGFIPTATSYKLRTIHILNLSDFSPEAVTAVEAALGPHGDFAMKVSKYFGRKEY